MNKAIFLDRDGVINKKALPHEYITSWKEFEFLPGVNEAIKKLSGSSFQFIFIVTNQAGIARGKMSLSDLEKIHFNMIKEIKRKGGRIDKIYFCPHGYSGCTCRKPLPGMLDLASKEFNIDLSESWIIGDSDNDIKLGKSRNCKTIYLGNCHPDADYIAKTLYEAVDLILHFD